MPRPCGQDEIDFSFGHIWELVVSPRAPEKVSTRFELARYLENRGYPKILCEEYAERNTTLCIEHILKECSQWDSLGIPRPLDVLNQQGVIVTWRHPKYESMTRRRPLPDVFPETWAWVRECLEREFLFCCAAYLWNLGCNRVFITDTSGDAGVDLVGVFDDGLFRNTAVFLQAKSSRGDVSKESMFSDYAKFHLLRFQRKWHDYRDAIGIDRSVDGMGLLYVFASNREFSPAISAAARDLPILLRSGKQIAYALALRAPLSGWTQARDKAGSMDASLSRNIATLLEASGHLGRTPRRI